MRVACLWFKNEVNIEAVAEDCLRFSPQIAVRAPDAVFLEIGKCYRLYSEETFLRKATALLQRIGVSATAGIGDSIEWALLAAKYGTTDLSLLPLRALFDLADPLAHDLRATPFVDKLITAIEKLGLKTLLQFKSVPRRELASRFGPVGLLCRQKLDSELLTPWKPWTPPEIVSESKEYLYSDFQVAVDPLLFAARSLLDRIYVRLRLRGLRASSLTINLRCEKLSISPERERVLKIEFLLPQSETKGTLTILRDFFEKEFGRRPLITPLEKFTITVSESTPGFMAQKNLFHSREERQEAFAALASQLAQSHGKESIFKAQTTEERLPEYSWQKVAKAEGQADLRGKIPLRPTHLTKPQKIEVTEQFIYIKQKPYGIRKWSESIERISSRWLNEPVDRTYFQVELENGPLLWIFCEQGKNFFLHGYYG